MGTQPALCMVMQAGFRGLIREETDQEKLEQVPDTSDTHVQAIQAFARLYLMRICGASTATRALATPFPRVWTPTP